MESGAHIHLERDCMILSSFFLFFKKFLFYSYVHTMFGSFLPSSPTTSLTLPPLLPLPCSLPYPPFKPHYLAETILPLSLILLKREYKQ
jgi:hypothetical protein